MESIEKLREWAASEHSFYHGIDIRTFTGKLSSYEKYALDALIDWVEREIAEKYMELPVDADGVPIHVGDEVMYGLGKAAHYVFAVSENAAWLNNSCHPPLVFLQEFASEQCRRVKSDPVKELLEEFVHEHCTGNELPDYGNPVYADYAAKIREAVNADERLR